MERYPEAMELLKTALAQLIEELRASGGAAHLVERKARLDDALRCLAFCARHHINPTARVVELPDQQAGYFGYRIMIDHETDDREFWTELQDETGTPVTAILGDQLVLNSEARNKKPPAGTN